MYIVWASGISFVIVLYVDKLSNICYHISYGSQLKFLNYQLHNFFKLGSNNLNIARVIKLS